MKPGAAHSVEFELHPGRGWLTAETGVVRVVNQNDANGYYKALGLKPDATREQIKAAYLKLIKLLHTDLGGDEELFQFIVEIAKVLLDPKKKSIYDAVSNPGAIYLGHRERSALIRNGMLTPQHTIPAQRQVVQQRQHWACLTTPGFLPGDDTDLWSEWCREVSPAVGYRGKICVGVVEGGHSWPCESSQPWGILTAGSNSFMVFQRGVEPNRLHALCAMIDWQRHLQKQSREKTTWQQAQGDSLESTREAKRLRPTGGLSVFSAGPSSSAGMALSPGWKTRSSSASSVTTS